MKALAHSIVVFLSILLALALFELFLRFQNYFISPNYDIEMWRYSKELKVQVADDNIGHIHIKNGQSNLQRIMVQTNEIGARGSKLLPFQNFDNNLVFIGSSVVLGWGVKNSDTLSSQVEKMSNRDGHNWQVVNAGIGNYNAKRTISNYFSNLEDFNWDTIVYGYFVNDAEKLVRNNGNFITRNFMVGVLAWKFWATISNKWGSLEEYYKAIYDPRNEGFVEMKKSMERLAKHCEEKSIRCVIAMIPDIHQTQPYKLGFIHDAVQAIADENNMEFLDLLPVLEPYQAEQLWNEYNDPHPNAIAHEIMGQKIYDHLISER